MAVNVNDFATIGNLGQLATATKGKLDEKIQKVTTSGSTVNFFTTSDTSGTPAFTFDFPEEIFLDQAGTTLVENFAWSAGTYPDSTNPNLEGKTVLVLAVKGDKETNPTTKYSFVNLEKLVDTYTASDTSLTITGYKIKLNISETTGNALTLENDGLYVDALPKVSNATAGNVPSLISDGTLSNSTVPVDDIVVKVTGGTTGNLVALDANGKIVDSGHGVAADADVSAYLATIFG